jgi:hypothetical protein
MEKNIYFALAGLPFVLFIIAFNSFPPEGDDGSFFVIFFLLALFSFILGVWGVRLLVKSNKKGERVLSLGLATLIASSVFILQCTQSLYTGIMNSFT